MIARRGVLAGSAALAATAGAAALWHTRRMVPDPSEIARAYANGLPPRSDPLSVYHLGHSLVGRDMPAMLAQLAGSAHKYHSQLGWGTPLRDHWEPGRDISGFDTENAHPAHRPARAAIASGRYDAVVLTEMVDIRAATRYHRSGEYFHRWAALARKSAPGVVVYLYETWPRLDVAGGWSARIAEDLPRHWEAEILHRDLARAGLARPPYVIPGGQVLAGFAARIAQTPLPGITALFARTQQGDVDPIHLNDLGNYLIALTHFAVLYRREPVGLPHRLRRANGSRANAPDAGTAALMQRTVREVVSGYAKTGVSL